MTVNLDNYSNIFITAYMGMGQSTRVDNKGSIRNLYTADLVLVKTGHNEYYIHKDRFGVGRNKITLGPAKIAKMLLLGNQLNIVKGVKVV